MFGKKKAAEVWSGEDILMRDILDELCSYRETMISLCQKIIVCEGSANMLPAGVDKDAELKELELCRKRILCTIGSYDDALRRYREIDNSKLSHFTGKAKWCTSHEMLRIAWQLAYGKVMGV